MSWNKMIRCGISNVLVSALWTFNIIQLVAYVGVDMEWY